MDKSEQPYADSYLSVHGGEVRDRHAQSLVSPIVQTATFTFEGVEDFEAFKAGKRSGYEYTRYGNPTQRVAEQKIAALEGAGDALLFSSGMAAVCSVLLAMLSSGQHMIVMEDCYRMTEKFSRSMKKFGISSEVIIMFTVMLLATFWNLVYAVGIGLLIACIFFMKKSGDSMSELSLAKYISKEKINNKMELLNIDGDGITDIAVKQIVGPLFFGSSDFFQKMISDIPDSCLLYTSPSPRDATLSRMPSSA